jgi:anti-sigma factor RsiW
MTEESLDNLLADHALGALPRDTTALLDAYLATNPIAQEKAARTQSLVVLARRALADGPAANVPLPPLNRRNIRHWRTAAWTALAAAGMAACLALGFWWGSPRPLQMPANVPALETRAPVAAPPVQTASTGGGVQNFWSVRRLRTYAAQQPPAQPAPIRKPYFTLGQIGG